MIGSLEVMHELIFTIPSVIQICSISSIDSIQLSFNLGKPRLDREFFLGSRGFFLQKYNFENVIWRLSSQK